MGCNNSKAVVQYEEIRPLCEAPGVVFQEEIQTVNSSSRNVASWVPEEGPVKATVLVSHGLSEHILCYYGIATELAKHGFAVYGVDHVSHGKSSGNKGVIPDGKLLYQDFIAFGNSVREKHPDVPLFLLAHSMGTLVGIMSINGISGLKAVVLSGPAIFAGPGASTPFGIGCLYPLSQTSVAVCLTSVTSVVDPAGPAAPLVLGEITSDPEELERIRKDPRRAQAYVTNKTAYELVKLIDDVKKELPNIKMPFVCIHGANDTIALPASSQYIYDHTGTAKELKKVHFFADSKHEPFHESAAIRTAAIDYVVSYFEEQYEIALDPSKAPAAAVEDTNTVEDTAGREVTIAAAAATGEGDSEECTLGTEEAADASAAVVSAANVDVEVNVEVERAPEAAKTMEPMEVEK